MVIGRPTPKPTTERITTAGIWAARNGDYDPAKAEKARRGMEAYERGPHRKAPPPKPRRKAPHQLWDTPNRQPPRGWEYVDSLCKTHRITLIYHPGLGAQLSDPALPGPMYADKPQQAIKAIALILSRRG